MMKKTISEAWLLLKIKIIKMIKYKIKETVSGNLSW